MPNRKDAYSSLRIGSSLLIIGFGVGWLSGLSVSPVVPIVIASVTGSAAAIIAVLSGLETRQAKSDDQSIQDSARQWSVSAVPLAVFVIGVIAGSALGIMARNNGVFGSGPSIAVAEWMQAGLVEPDWPRQEIARKLFESQYPVSGSLTNTVAAPASGTITLGSYLFFAVSPDECTNLLAAVQLSDDASLLNVFSSLSDEQLSNLPQAISDTNKLRNVVEQVLCANR